jgi:hypothetical protein
MQKILQFYALSDSEVVYRFRRRFQGKNSKIAISPNFAVDFQSPTILRPFKLQSFKKRQCIAQTELYMLNLHNGGRPSLI